MTTAMNDTDNITQCGEHIKYETNTFLSVKYHFTGVSQFDHWGPQMNFDLHQCLRLYSLCTQHEPPKCQVFFLEISKFTVFS